MDEPVIPILAGTLERRATFSHGLSKTFQSGLLACYSRFADFINRAKSGLIDRPKFSSSLTSHAGQNPEPFLEPNLGALNCQVELTRQKKDASLFDAFTVQIAGSIYAASDADRATVQILITDVTDGTRQAKPVQARVKQWQMEERSGRGGIGAFCYRGDLGKLPGKVVTLSHWTTVAHVNLDWLLFPRKGPRALQFRTSVLSGRTGEELAGAVCLFTYENPTFGYIDVQENAHRTATLAVGLAFAVSAADGKLYSSEIELIKNWAKANLAPANAGARPGPGANAKLDKALDHAVGFFQSGNQIDTYKICQEIADIAPLADRYDVLGLCLQVVRAKGFLAPEELSILKNLASWLNVDMSRFRAMMEKSLPVNMHQVKDMEVILGVTSDMNQEKTRQQLNKEYGKWNSRVTNSDPEIQAQADQMLKLIAEARSQYVG
jgi:tellurite resistance protein